MGYGPGVGRYPPDPVCSVGTEAKEVAVSEKWTEGPWFHWQRDGSVRTAPENQPGRVVAWLDLGFGYRARNGELIAAAPEMAEALASLVLYEDGHESRHCGPEECRCGLASAIVKALAALAKARGES